MYMHELSRISIIMRGQNKSIDTTDEARGKKGGEQFVIEKERVK